MNAAIRRWGKGRLPRVLQSPRHMALPALPVEEPEASEADANQRAPSLLAGGRTRAAARARRGVSTSPPPRSLNEASAAPAKALCTHRSVHRLTA